VIKPAQNQPFSNRGNAIGRRRADLRRLDCLVQSIGIASTDFFHRGTGTQFRRLTNSTGNRRTDSGEIRSQKSGQRRAIGLCLDHSDQPSQLHAIRVGLDFFWFRRQFFGAAMVIDFILVGIDVMDRHVRIGNCRLLEIIVDSNAY